MFYEVTEKSPYLSPGKSDQLVDIPVHVQKEPYNPDTHGLEGSVLISEVADFSGYGVHKHYICSILFGVLISGFFYQCPSVYRVLQQMY